jgi:hypothetical protein
MLRQTTSGLTGVFRRRHGPGMSALPSYFGWIFQVVTETLDFVCQSLRLLLVTGNEGLRVGMDVIEQHPLKLERDLH